MREILFRGKQINTKNQEWRYGDLLHNGYDYEYAIRDKKDSAIYGVVPETISEFTGLTDKNGTKIFEGDILQYTRKNWHEPLSSKNNQDMICFCEIYFDEKTHCFRFYHYDDETKRCIGSGLLTFDDSRAEENIIEVIGNIYDNPELLKGERNDRIKNA